MNIAQVVEIPKFAMCLARFLQPQRAEGPIEAHPRCGCPSNVTIERCEAWAFGADNLSKGDPMRQTGGRGPCRNLMAGEIVAWYLLKVLLAKQPSVAAVVLLA